MHKTIRLVQRAASSALALATGLDGFLKAHDVWTDYTVDDFRRELRSLSSPGL